MELVEKNLTDSDELALNQHGPDLSELSEDSIGDSPAPYSSDEREVERGVRAVIELHQLAILRMLARLLLFLVAPIIFLIVVFELSAGRSFSPPFVAEVAFLGMSLLGAFRDTLVLPLRRRLTVIGLLGLSIAALLQFGPLMGTGFVYIAALLGCALLLNPLEASGGAALLVLSILMPVLGAHGLFGPGFQFPGPQLSSSMWLRLFASCTAGTIGILYVFLRVQRSLWKSFEKEISMRLRERRLVSEREKVLRRAASSQRLESLGRLAGGIAHDFNNALVVIQCGIEAFADDLPLDEQREVIDELGGAVERAATTARQLLSFAKRNVEEMGSSDPASVVERLAKESQRLLPAHIQFECEIKDPPRVALSEAALEQLVLNLVQNARDALLLDGGKIRVLVSTEQATKGLLLEVADDGPGMHADIAERAFEPFFTTKGDQGAGLGLATVWGVVQRHGGEVTLDTKEGKGTTVSLHLPAMAPESLVRTKAEVSQPPRSLFSQSERPRVLVLEDEPPVRSALRRIFLHIGFDVSESSTVAEARAQCRLHSFDLLLTDGVVPDGGVGGFIAEFRARQRDAPVILCSGYLEEDLALQGIARGDCVFLAKPFSAQELCRIVADLVPGAAGVVQAKIAAR